MPEVSEITDFTKGVHSVPHGKQNVFFKLIAIFKNLILSSNKQKTYAIYKCFY